MAEEMAATVVKGARAAVAVVKVELKDLTVRRNSTAPRIRRNLRA